MNSFQKIKLFFSLSWALFFGAGVVIGTLFVAVPQEQEARFFREMIPRAKLQKENVKNEIQEEYNALLENLYQENEFLQKQLKQTQAFLQGIQLEFDRKHKMQERQKSFLQKEVEELKSRLTQKITQQENSDSTCYSDLSYLLELRLGEKIVGPIQKVFSQKISMPVSVSTAVPKKLASLEMDSLANQVIEKIEQYSYATVEVAHFEPQLKRLVAENNRDAAVRVLAIHHHAQELFLSLEKNLAELQQKERVMLKQSRRRSSSQGSVKAQKAQRLLDLTSKKIQIQTRHKARLHKFREAIFNAISSFHSHELALFLMESFDKNTEILQQKAVLNVVVQARALEVAPILMEHISVRHPELTQSICEALTALTGVDHGKDRSKWKKWWADQKRLSKENS